MSLNKCNVLFTAKLFHNNGRAMETLWINKYVTRLEPRECYIHNLHRGSPRCVMKFIEMFRYAEPLLSCLPTPNSLKQYLFCSSRNSNSGIEIRLGQEKIVVSFIAYIKQYDRCFLEKLRLGVQVQSHL